MGQQATQMASYRWFDEWLPAWYSPDANIREEELEEINKIHSCAQSVMGWLSKSQGTALYQLARRRLPADVLEIGSLCGKPTIFIALGCKHSGSTLYAIDPPQADLRWRQGTIWAGLPAKINRQPR